MREAADALAEFQHLLPVYCPEAMAHYEQALLHFDVALALCARSEASAYPADDAGDDDDRESDDPGDEDRDDDGGDDDDGPGPNLRIKW